MICPILFPVGDQQFWGQQAYKKGLAVKPTPISKMTEKKFMESIKELLTNQKLYEGVKQIKRQIDLENGILKTVEEIERSAVNNGLA